MSFEFLAHNNGLVVKLWNRLCFHGLNAMNLTAVFIRQFAVLEVQSFCLFKPRATLFIMTSNAEKQFMQYNLYFVDAPCILIIAYLILLALMKICAYGSKALQFMQY